MGIDPTRRSLLKLGLGGTAVLVLGGIGLSMRRPVLVPALGPLLVFNQREFSICTAIAETMCPGEGTLPSAQAIGVAAKLDALLHVVHPGVGKEIRQVLNLFENPVASMLFDRRITPFTHLDAGGRSEALQRWRTSSLDLRRQAYKGLHGLVTAAYWGDPRTYASVGYPGPPDYGNLTTAVP
jgi:hypothetical protein